MGRHKPSLLEGAGQHPPTAECAAPGAGRGAPAAPIPPARRRAFGPGPGSSLRRSPARLPGSGHWKRPRACPGRRLCPCLWGAAGRLSWALASRASQAASSAGRPDVSVFPALTSRAIKWPSPPWQGQIRRTRLTSRGRPPVRFSSPGLPKGAKARSITSARANSGWRARKDATWPSSSSGAKVQVE